MDNPLDLSNTRLRLTDQFKSVFSHGVAVTDLGCHVPSVQAEPEIHRHTRSELEYAGKVLYPYANKQKQFKPNRKGYLLPKESVESRQLASNLLGPTHQPPQAYRDSLEAFIDR